MVAAPAVEEAAPTEKTPDAKTQSMAQAKSEEMMEALSNIVQSNDPKLVAAAQEAI